MEIWPHILCDKSARGQMPHLHVSSDLRLVSVGKLLCHRYGTHLEFNNYFITSLCTDFPVLQEKLS